MPQGREFGRLGKKMVKEIEKYRLVVQNSHGDAKYSMGNIVNIIVVTMYGARWVLELSGETLHKVYDCLTTMLYS